MVDYRRVKIKKYKCKQGEICEFTVKTKNQTHLKQRHFTMVNVAKVEGVFLAQAFEVFHHCRSANEIICNF